MQLIRLVSSVRGLGQSALIFMFLIFSAVSFTHAATLSDCGFENSNALDGTWTSLSVETEVTYGGTWTPAAGPDNITTVHSGANAMRFNAVAESLVFTPAVAGPIGYVSFWFASNGTAACTLELQYSTNGGATWSDGLSGNPAPPWSQTFAGLTNYTYTGPIAIYQPGNTILRWYMTVRTNGAAFIDDVQIFDTASTPTPTASPTMTPTPTPCNGNLYNCGFELGNTNNWTLTGGGSTGGTAFCGGPWPNSGSYAFWNVANFGNLNGNLYQIVTPTSGSVSSVIVTCWARDADDCQASSGTVEVGVDPAAGTNPSAGTVQYGTPVVLTAAQQQASSPTVGVSGNYTLFLRYVVTQGGTSWSFVNIDDVQITEILDVKEWSLY